MKIVKELDLMHDVFKDYEKEENILEIFRFESPSGYMIIRRTGDNFNIKVTAEDDIKVIDELKKIVSPYLKGDVCFTFDQKLECLKLFIESKGLNYWFGMYGLSMSKKPLDMAVGSLQSYNNEVDLYSEIIGKCFEPMRAKHEFKPYDCYKGKRDEAIKEFEEAAAKGCFYGYKVEGTIIGAAIAVDQELDILAVSPKLQKNGYGRQLLKGVLNDMFKTYEVVEISVVESNTHVLKLYESEGFTIDSHKKMYKNY